MSLRKIVYARCIAPGRFVYRHRFWRADLDPQTVDIGHSSPSERLAIPSETSLDNFDTIALVWGLTCGGGTTIIQRLPHGKLSEGY